VKENDMAINPNEPLSVLDKRTFGVNAFRHPVCGFIVEMGHGALSVDRQVENYLAQVASTEGKPAASALRVAVEKFKAGGGTVPEPPEPSARMSHARGSAR
jgi:hypothetical protein